MKKLTIAIIAFVLTLSAGCQDRNTFDSTATFNGGFRFSKTGEIYKSMPTAGAGNMIYPGSGIPTSLGGAWGPSIVNNSTNWNTSFSWGNHAGLYRLITWKPDWTGADILNKPILSKVATSNNYQDLDNKPPESELLTELGLLKYWKIQPLTTAEINALVIPANEIPIVYNSTIKGLQIKIDGVWITFITNK